MCLAGYRARRHIAKSLQTRSRAIRNALNTFNAAAQSLSPPRPTLDWQTVSHYRFLQEFELLNDTRADLQDREWAQPVMRELMRQAFHLARAKEEIIAVNREARRIHTSIRDENVLFTGVLNGLQQTGDILHGAVLDYATRRRRAGAHILAALQKLYQLREFSGIPYPGVRLGQADIGTSSAAVTVGPGLEIEVRAAEDGDSHEDGLHDDDGDEEDQDDLTALTDFIANLST